MSKFLKNVLDKQNNLKSDDITNYLIKEIEDIVAKKVCNTDFRKLAKEDIELNDNLKPHNNFSSSYYIEGVNYSLQKEQPFKATTYIKEASRDEYLPFEENDLKPKIHNVDQIKSLVKRTLRPALNQWLDDNLDFIIEKAIKKNYTKYRKKPISKRSFHYYDE